MHGSGGLTPHITPPFKQRNALVAKAQKKGMGGSGKVEEQSEKGKTTGTTINNSQQV